MQYINKALDTIKKSFSKTLKPQQRKQLMRDRFVLLRNKEDLIPADRLNRDIGFTMLSTLHIAYYIKKGLRNMYLCKTKQQAIAYHKEWKSYIPHDMKPFIEVASIIDNWHTEVFNYFDYFVINAFTESINNTIKEIAKHGRNYSFEVVRAKVLFGTKATVKSKFGEQSFGPIDNTIGNILYGSFDFSRPKLIKGFGVSFHTYLKL